MPIPMLLALLIGCASSTSSTIDKLDRVTGVTTTFVNTPVTLYRDTPSQGAYARSYLQLAPIQVNRSGTYQYFIWIGIWSTMQTSSLTEHRDGLETVIVFADGEPLTLESSGWTPEAIGTSEPVYLKPVANSADAYYRVTADQIRVIAEARDIRLRTTGPSPSEFELWNRQAAARNDLNAFVTRTR